VPPLLIAQLTDTHAVARNTDEELFVDNNGRLVAAVAQINAESPAVRAVLATGDLTNSGHPDEYKFLVSEVSSFQIPYLALPGNHDDRDLLRESFPDNPWVDEDHASWVTTVDGDGDLSVRIVGLDSTRLGEHGAEFDTEREDWLRSTLATHHTGPTILAMHHPPFVTGIGWMDGTGFVGRDRFAAVLAEHPVDRIVCGHMHRPIASSVAGIPAQVGLSTVQHVALGLGEDDGISMIREPVGYQILRVTEAGIVVHTRYIDGEESPFVPTWAADF
jgi:Icc protein